MFETLSLGRVLGVQVRVHLLFLYLVLGLVVWAGLNGRAVPVAIAIVTLFGLVLLHELGHAVVARRYGIRVIDIVLWPLGGMARMSEIPERPRVEAAVAIGGPAVNLVLATLGLAALAVVRSSAGFDPSSFDPLSASAGLLQVFVTMNLALGLLNLVPAFPMDGGRLLRAFLARGGRSWVAATDRAVQVGRYFAYAFIVVGLFVAPCTLPLIGLFVLWAGARERWAVHVRHRADTGGGADPWRELFRQHAASAYGRPGEGSAPAESESEGGFSDEDVRRLEEFRGRLRRDR